MKDAFYLALFSLVFYLIWKSNKQLTELRTKTETLKNLSPTTDINYLAYYNESKL